MIERRADVLKSEQLTLIPKFMGRDVPIQHAAEKSPFQVCLREKLALIFPQETQTPARCVSVLRQARVANLPVQMTGRFLEVILRV